MKAYNLCSASYTKAIIAGIITLFHKRCTGKLRSIRAAPPRVALQVFGGHMSIEQYRAASEEPVQYEILPPRMIVHQDVIHERHETERAARPRVAKSLQDVVSFDDASTSNEPLRLKRAKPLQKNRNLLEKIMGIRIEQH
jgi:hypothetical protein